MAKETGEVIGVVREWKPEHLTGIDTIHDTIDSWGRANEAAPAPKRDYAAIEAAVDRITKRVKARKVVVQETVTEFVDADTVEFTEETPWDGEATSTVIPPAPPMEAVPSGKRKPKILGWFGPKSQKQAVDAAVEARSGSTEYRPQCVALTEDGAQCRNSAREGSKYCASHKGYQPPTAKGIAQRVEGAAWDPSDNVTDKSSVRRANTKPTVRKAKDTKVAVRKVKPNKKGKAKSSKKAKSGARKPSRKAKGKKR